MKSLTISFKPSSEILDDFKKALKGARSSQKQHDEISFDDKKSFDKFVRNIDILTYIQHFHPSSVYELANLMKRDVSNLNKVVSFYEMTGALSIKKKIVNGREVSKPTVLFDRIVFNVAA